MLKHFKLKNWRSLRDLHLDDLTPLTVLIGANSAGKSNILDALRFLQYASTEGHRGIVGALRYRWGGPDQVLTQGVPISESIRLEFTYQPAPTSPDVRSYTTFRFTGQDAPYINYEGGLYEGDQLISGGDELALPLTGMSLPPKVFAAGDWLDRGSALHAYTTTYITRRWQFLDEGFTPQLAVPSQAEVGDLYRLNPDASNLPYVLDLMRATHHDLFTQLLDDMRWLLAHVADVQTLQTSQELRIALTETRDDPILAPTVSAGTARLVAMLAAYYVLDMDRNPIAVRRHDDNRAYADLEKVVAQMPGVVLIEEPDTALNPGLMGRFVELLRTYTEREDVQRQFILTTHNPALLNHLTPDEVRVVTRDEEGTTQVQRIPEHIKDIWLDEYGLGEVWLSNAFEGLNE